MARGSTSLANNEYDSWLAKNKKSRELKERKIERAQALKKDLSGYAFNIDPRGPVKVKDAQQFRRELDKRGLAIEGEYRGDKRRIPEYARRAEEARKREYGNA